MRVMVRATLDIEKANQVLQSGKMQEMIKSVLDKTKPEAAYFGQPDGQRTCFLVVDMEDSSELPPTVEPFFRQLNAKVEVFPIMNLDDLQKGLSAAGR